MNETNAIREALYKYGIRMSEFARAEEIPLRTFHNWCYGERKPAPYLERWCIEKIEQYAKKLCKKCIYYDGFCCRNNKAICVNNSEYKEKAAK